MNYRKDFGKTWFSWPSLTPFAIGPHSDPYMLRWRLFPSNKWGNLYLHKFRHSDDDRALHDHPWKSLSFLLSGKTREVYKDPTTGQTKERTVKKFLPLYRTASFAHRIILDSGPAWTLFFTGPRIREWGFLCPQGWRHWRDFVNKTNPGERGPGCD